jgi:hypothetical protein
MRAIGFHRHQETLVKDDNPQLRGMLHQVRHLVRVEEVTSAGRRKVTAPKVQPGAKAAEPVGADAEQAAATTPSAEPEAKEEQPVEEDSAAEKKTTQQKAEQ